MTYFDSTDEEDLKLLPSGQRDATDLDVIAAAAEADVIGVYTRSVTTRAYPPHQSLVEHPYVDLGDGRGVFLRGYREVPDAESDENPIDEAFLLAMKRTIARVIGWRIEQAGRDLAAEHQTDFQGKTRTWREGHDAPFPRSWDRDLRPYDTRPPAWGC